ncbi:MAG TPA: metalloregulator ArsR/SmtB family transcription factor [Gemmatimonadales bacterium]|nr:metalloregulator ArsR/SmtB family transcription factor [Gemmatimonadales bacterium]
MKEAPDELTEVWRALANPLRRRMLDILRGGPATTSEMAEHFPRHSRFAVMQHLAVLARGGLVVFRREGRRRVNYLNPIPIQRIYDRWVSRYEEAWAESLVALKRGLESDSSRRRRPAEP